MHQSSIRMIKLVIAFVTVIWSIIPSAFANDGDDFTLKDGSLIVTAITRSHQESDFQSYKRIQRTHPERQIQYSSDVTSGFFNGRRSVKSLCWFAASLVSCFFPWSAKAANIMPSAWNRVPIYTTCCLPRLRGQLAARQQPDVRPGPILRPSDGTFPRCAARGEPTAKKHVAILSRLHARSQDHPPRHVLRPIRQGQNRVPISPTCCSCRLQQQLATRRQRDVRLAPLPHPSHGIPYRVAPIYTVRTASLPQRNSAPSTHIRCSTTASLRARATFARFMPR